MKFQLKIITVFILSCCLPNLDAVDIKQISSFVTPNVLKCYTCSSLKTDHCRNITSSPNKDKLIKECQPNAQGCVKQWVQRYDNKTAVFRECYYGSIGSILTTFECEGISRTYDQMQCYKCRGDLCNKGSRQISRFAVWFVTLASIIACFLLKM